jgi:hypothetical protein
MADDGYDPRFDPAFQRGFEGETVYPPRQAPAAPSRHDARQAPERMVAPMPEFLRVRPRAEQPPNAIDEEYRSAPARAVREPEPHAAAVPLPPPPPLRSNPFLIAALVIAIALIGAGVLIGSRIDLWYDDVSGDGPGFGLLNMLQVGAPLAICLGIATVIAVLIILALRWRGRPDDRTSEN